MYAPVHVPTALAVKRAFPVAPLWVGLGLARVAAEVDNTPVTESQHLMHGSLAPEAAADGRLDAQAEQDRAVTGHCFENLRLDVALALASRTMQDVGAAAAGLGRV